MAYDIAKPTIYDHKVIATVATLDDARAYFAERFDTVDMEEDAANPDHYDVAGFRDRSIDIKLFTVEPA